MLLAGICALAHTWSFIRFHLHFIVLSMFQSLSLSLPVPFRSLTARILMCTSRMLHHVFKIVLPPSLRPLASIHSCAVVCMYAVLFLWISVWQSLFLSIPANRHMNFSFVYILNVQKWETSTKHGGNASEQITTTTTKTLQKAEKKGQHQPM